MNIQLVLQIIGAISAACFLIAVGLIVFGVKNFDPYVCSKDGGHMSEHICGHLHCDNVDCDGKLK